MNLHTPWPRNANHDKLMHSWTQTGGRSMPGPVTSKSMSRASSISFRGVRLWWAAPPACGRVSCIGGGSWGQGRREGLDALAHHQLYGDTVHILLLQLGKIVPDTSFLQPYVALFDARVWAHARLRVGTALCLAGRLDVGANDSNQQMWDAWAWVTADSVNFVLLHQQLNTHANKRNEQDHQWTAKPDRWWWWLL